MNIALGSAALAQCEPFDADGDIAVTVDEIVAAVTNALNGCMETPTAPPTGTPPPTTPTAISTSTSPPPSTPTTTATVDVVDVVSRQILGRFYGEVRADFRVSDSTFLIQQIGTAEVLVTNVDRFIFSSISATAETPTRIVYVYSDSFMMQSLTLELVAPGQLMGTYVVAEGTEMLTYTLDLELLPF